MAVMPRGWARMEYRGLKDVIEEEEEEGEEEEEEDDDDDDDDVKPL